MRFLKLIFHHLLYFLVSDINLTQKKDYLHKNILDYKK